MNNTNYNQPTCDYCKGYAVSYPLYIGQWRFHPNNPMNPYYKKPEPVYCPKCGPTKEENK